MRVGQGIDVHRFGGPGPVLMLGIVVDDIRGIAATSDGDVPAQALTDAVLGAAALGDIGMLAPASDPSSEGADSMDLLTKAVGLVADAGYEVVNVDVTIVSQSIRVAPYRLEMQERTAAALGIEMGAVSIKATTTDGLGMLGRDEGVAALATATIRPQE